MESVWISLFRAICGISNMIKTEKNTENLEKVSFFFLLGQITVNKVCLSIGVTQPCRFQTPEQTFCPLRAGND